MTTFGRVAVTVVLIAALFAGTAGAVWYLRGGLSEAEGAGGGEPSTLGKILNPGEVQRRKLEAAHQSLEAAKTEHAARQPPHDSNGPSTERSRQAPAGEGDADGPPSTDAEAPGDARAREGLGLYRKNDRMGAQRVLSKALQAGVSDSRRQAVHDALCALGYQVLHSGRVPRDYPGTTRYTVEPGDTLSGIADRFLVPYATIKKLNGLSSNHIYAGQQLTVVRGPVHVLIRREARELSLWLDDRCIGAWPVAIGREDSTPVGTFIVKNKVANPPYQPQHKARSAHRPAGHPENPLGTRWIDVGNHYGIHGTNEPDSIGKAVSEGCIRMRNEAVEVVYDFVATGASKVKIE